MKAVLLGRGDVGPALKAIELNLEWNRVMHLYARGHRGFFVEVIMIPEEKVNEFDLEIKKNNTKNKCEKKAQSLDGIDFELSKLASYCKKELKSAKKGAKILFKSIREDVNAVRERDPAARSNLEVLMLYSGVHALIAHRIAHGLYRKKHYFSARAVSQIARAVTGIEIHPGARIGKGLMIDHGMGVVIGETSVIGDNCTIYQGVTLGGTGKDVGKRHPTLGNNVMVGAGAKVLGPFNIGDNTKIAANAVVLKEIPEESTAVGIPARVVRREGVKIENDLDQIHVPDPVAQELRRLESRLAELEAELTSLKAEKAEKAEKLEKLEKSERKSEEN